ncbi:leukocyte antigen CD37 isoform X2 [Notamacropus eugenii]|uniref:leukocyte antigen CD37 isoform X2 n=1 Tax=Notamacropus eugenii TaxID=9315 RepID=UPI003B67D412
MEGPKETEIRDPEETKENPRGSEETEGIRGPAENAETRNPGENERIRGSDETEGIKGPKATEIRDPGGSDEIRVLEETEKIRDPEETAGIRGPGDTEETRGPGETWSPERAKNRDGEESEETRSPGDTRTPKETEVRGPEGPEGIRDPEESKETRTPKETEGSGPEGYKETRTPEEAKETRIPKETEGSSPDESNETRTSRERKQRASVRFEIGEFEETEKTRTPDSSQDTREPKEPGDPRIPKEPRDLPEVKAMAEKGCLSLTKYFLFVFNIFFFVLGSLVFCFGLWILIDKNSFASYLGLSFIPLKVWSYALAISGVLTGLLSLLGCLGALKEIRCLLGLITIGVLIYTQHGLLERKVKDIVLDVIENYHKYPDAYSTAENWDFVQFQLRCCGWTSPQDWLLASSLRPNGSVTSGSGRASTSSPTPSRNFLPSPQTSASTLRVPCSCQNTSVITSTPQSPADDPRASQPAAEPGARVTVVSAPGMPVVLPGPGSPGTPARLRSGELCSMPADSGVYQEGCSRSIYTWLHNNLISIVGVSLGLGLLEVAAVGLTLVMLPHSRGWGSRCQGLEGESSAAGWGGNCGSGTSSSKWGTACRCATWGSQGSSLLPATVERWLPRQRQASRPSTIWSSCRLEPQGCE